MSGELSRPVGSSAGMTSSVRTGGTVFVLAGGGSLGAVQVGMLDALVVAGVTPDFVLGTSVGAINGVFFASDPSAAGVERLGRIWAGISRRDVYPLAPLGWLSAVFGARTHLMNPAGLRSVIERNLPVKRLEETAVPCAVIAADLLDGRQMILSSGSAAVAVLASASLPVLLPPVRIGGRDLVDGALANTTAISTALDLGATRVVVLPTGFSCAVDRPPRNAVAIAMHVVSVLLARQLANEVERHAQRTLITVVPPVCPMPVSSYDFRRGAWLRERAAESTSQWLATGGLENSAVPATLRPHSH